MSEQQSNKEMPETRTVPTYFAALDEIAAILGTTRTDSNAERDREKAREKLLSYYAASVNDYLDVAYPLEEERRQKQNQLCAIVILSVVVYLIVLFILLCHSSPLLKAYAPLFVIPGNLIAVLRYAVGRRTSFRRARLQGQAMMLAEFAGMKQVPLLVKALPIPESRVAIKQKLSSLLPLYALSDEQMLDVHMVAELTRQLQKAMAQVTWQQDAKQVEGDVAFVTAILIYFERELAQGKPVPRNVIPILEQFAVAVPGSVVSESQWQMMKTATEECLAYAVSRR